MSWWTSANLHPKTKNRFVVVFSNVFYLPNVKSISKPEVQIETKEYRLLNHTFNYPGNAKWQPVTVKFVDMNGTAATEDTHFDTSQFLWQILNNTGYAYPHFDESAIREPMYMNVGKSGEIQGRGHHISTKINFRDDPRTQARELDTWRTITTPEKSSNIANSFGLGLEGEIDMKPAGVSRQRVAIYQISPDSIINEAWYLVNPIVKNIKWGDLAYEDDALVEYELQIVYDWAILDRQANGTKLVVEEEPYKYFMATLKSNKDTIETEQQFEEILAREAQIRADMEEFYANQYSPGTVEELTAMDPPVADSFIDDIENAESLQEVAEALKSAKEAGASDLALEGLADIAEDKISELRFSDVGDLEDDFTYDEEGFEELDRERREAEERIQQLDEDLREQQQTHAKVFEDIDIDDGGEFTYDESLREMQEQGDALQAGIDQMGVETNEQRRQRENEEFARNFRLDQSLDDVSQELPYDPTPSRTDEEFDLEYNRGSSSQVTPPEQESGLGTQNYLDQQEKEKEELEAFLRERDEQDREELFSETDTTYDN